MSCHSLILLMKKTSLERDNLASFLVEVVSAAVAGGMLNISVCKHIMKSQNYRQRFYYKLQQLK